MYYTSHMPQASPYATKPAASRSTARVSSRLAKRQQKEILWQTVGIMVAAVGLVLLFIFAILPLVIRLFTNLSDGVISLDNADTLPPQVPILSAPPRATKDSTYLLSGYGEPESQVIVVHNQTDQLETQVSVEGSFEISIPLLEGENSLAAYSVDDAGNESALTTTYSLSFDQQAPTIELSAPTEGQEFVSKSQQSITVEGTTEPQAYIYINGRRYQANSEGIFKASVRLVEGDNQLAFKAEDAAGNVTEKTMVVTYRD